MPQTSLYMDDATMEVVRAESARRGISLSRFIAGAISNYVDHVSGGWPVGYWDQIYGCLDDQTAEDMLSVREGDGLDSALDDDCTWFVQED